MAAILDIDMSCNQKLLYDLNLLFNFFNVFSNQPYLCAAAFNSEPLL